MSNFEFIDSIHTTEYTQTRMLLKMLENKEFRSLFKKIDIMDLQVKLNKGNYIEVFEN